jgi:chorismate mutase
MGIEGMILPMSVRAIRGATQVEENSASAIAAGTKELLAEILRSNNLEVGQVISVLLTATPDLNAAFPAAAAREVGFESTPLLCAVEIDVPGALQRVVRAMVTVETSASMAEISHIYLGGAKALRRDIAQ